MLRKITRLKHFCGLDIGVFGIKAALAKAQDKQNLDLLGVYENRSTGFKDAAVSDLTDLAEAVSRTVKGLSQKFSLPIQSVHLGISSEFLTSRRCGAVIPLVDSGTKTINRSDVKKVDHQARLLGAGLDEEVVHAFPQFYKVDDVNAATKPIGLYGRKLESNVLLLLANANRLRNVVKAVHQAGLEVSDVSLSTYAAAEVGLTPAQRAQGCALVDIGANTTTVLFFQQGMVADIQSIPWGGNYLTRNLAQRLGLTIELAEDIKKAHAVASETALQSAAAAGQGKAAGASGGGSGEILIKREKDYLPVRSEVVCEAVNWEVENLLTHLDAVIRGSPLFHELNAGLVVAGGGALLPGLMERIEGRVTVPVTLGATKGLNQAALFAGAIGLSQMHYVRNLRETVDLKTPLDWKNKAFERLKEMCQEYF